jgi:hypothetical protein
MRWQRLFEPTRPVDRRRRGATSLATASPTTGRTKSRTTGHKTSGRGRPDRGARPPKSVPAPRRRRRRINWTRVTALTLSLTMVVALAWLAGGPLLRVRSVSYAGAGWTSDADLNALTAPIIGRSALMVDAAGVALELSALPGVEGASVEVGVMGSAQVTLVEGGAVALWRTSAAQLLLAEDGTVVGVQSRDAVAGGSLVDLPVIDDLRDASHDLTVGDALPASELDAALALAALTGSRLGSQTAVLDLAVDPTYGFVLSSPQAGWRAAFGYYGLDPLDTPDRMTARIASQASAVRTLFAAHPEAGVAWVDARNPGKVYFRARG